MCWPESRARVNVPFGLLVVACLFSKLPLCFRLRLLFLKSNFRFGNFRSKSSRVLECVCVVPTENSNGGVGREDYQTADCELLHIVPRMQGMTVSQVAELLLWVLEC